MMKRKECLVLFVMTGLVACASSIENVQRETARSIGGDVLPDKVAVKNLDRGTTSVKWDASTPKGDYQCSADDMMRRVLCVKYSEQ
jgi:hypothetical protein